MKDYKYPSMTIKPCVLGEKVFICENGISRKSNQQNLILKKNNLSQFFLVECTFGVLFKNPLFTLQLVTLTTKLQ